MDCKEKEQEETAKLQIVYPSKKKNRLLVEMENFENAKLLSPDKRSNSRVCICSSKFQCAPCYVRCAVSNVTVTHFAVTS
jgi:hypothetical protein